MELQLPVIWTLHGTTSPGRVDVTGGRVELTSRGRAFAFPLDRVATSMIDRSPARRLRGLPVLLLGLVGGVTVAVASMGGPGSLQDLSAAVSRRQDADSGT
jgi:hypothetical protein